MLAGIKSKKLTENLILPHVPEDIENWIYVEPFGGSFSVYHWLNKKAKLSVYNDIKTYNHFDIKADRIHHLDYKEIFEMYDSENTFFYLDPPYYKREYLYGLESFDHEELKRQLLKLKGKFAMSYENCSYIQKLYKDFNIHYYTGDNPFLKREILITL